MSFFSYSLGEYKFAYSNNFLPLNMKSINPIQKYPHIIESCAWILVIFVIFLSPMNFLNAFGICLTPKLWKYVKFSALTCKAMQCDPIDLYSSRLMIYATSFILDKLFLE